ncbi:MAG TPA: iron-sulfur cluster repair di-iron protein [Hanamia sp.]
MNTTIEKTVGNMVAEDYRAAAVFESFGIDFCCQGNKTIDEVCETKGINKSSLLLDLGTALQLENNTLTDYNAWPINLLADYIEKRHHKYVEDKTPALKQYIEKICSVHGQKHAELFQIKDLFNRSARELAAHMKKEELMLFPFIRKMMHAKEKNISIENAHFGSVQNPIQMMMHEHDTEGENFRKINALSANYNAPADACNTYKVTFALLKEFEADLHLHIHLENNILFPKAVELEKQLFS